MNINYEIGKRFILAEDFNKAVLHLRKAVDQGDMGAANDLGVIYERNDMFRDAFKMYEMSACAGDAVSICNVGGFYEKGLSVKKDINKAITYFEHAAKLGYSCAYRRLAKLYLYGIGVEKDYKKAMTYLKKGIALERKDKFRSCDCVNALAYNYSEGLGVKKNSKKALKLWKLSAKHGDNNGNFNLAICYLHGHDIKKNVRKAISILIRLACQERYGYAINTLSEIFSDEEYGFCDLEEAGFWLMEGAQCDDTQSLLKIAKICLSGKKDDYKFRKDFSENAILDFLKIVKGSEKEYIEEIKDYEKLREEYISSIDWDFLETLPDSLDDKREGQDVC